VGDGPGDRGLEQRAAEAEAPGVTRHAHTEHADVRRGGVRIGGHDHVADEPAAEPGAQGEARVARGRRRDAAAPLARRDVARHHEQRGGRLGRDGVDQPAERPGVARARRPDRRRATVTQRYRQLTVKQRHGRPRRRVTVLTSRARARFSPRERPVPQRAGRPAGGTASSSRSPCRHGGRT